MAFQGYLKMKANILSKNSDEYAEISQLDQFSKVLQKYEDNLLFLLFRESEPENTPTSVFFSEILKETPKVINTGKELDIHHEKLMHKNYIKAILFAVLIVLFLFCFFFGLVILCLGSESSITLLDEEIDNLLVCFFIGLVFLCLRLGSESSISSLLSLILDANFGFCFLRGEADIVSEECEDCFAVLTGESSLSL